MSARTNSKKAARSSKSASAKAKSPTKKAAKPAKAKASAAKQPKAAKAAKPAARSAKAAPAQPAAKKKPGRGAPPPKIGRGSRGGPKQAAPPKAAAPRKSSRQRVRVCKQDDCTETQTTQGFCRLHYLANWKAIREEKERRAQKNLDRYVERMAGTNKKPAAEDEDGEAKTEEAVFEEDFGEFVDVLSREENLDKILNGIKVEDY